MNYVYVIVNEVNKIYIGYTKDLRNRMKEHNDGKNRSTKNHRWRLAYYEAFSSRLDALERERKLKRSSQAKR